MALQHQIRAIPLMGAPKNVTRNTDDVTRVTHYATQEEVDHLRALVQAQAARIEELAALVAKKEADNAAKREASARRVREWRARKKGEE